MEATTRSRESSSLTSGGITNTGKIHMILGDEGDREAARGPREPGLVFDEVERFPLGDRREEALASGI